MFFKTDKSYRYVFLLIISLMTVFNKSSNYIFIQFNFIAISIFFLLFIKEKNYFAHIRKIFSKNKIAISLFFFFIIFLIFQTIPLPIEWIKSLSPGKYVFLNRLEFSGRFNSISLNPVNSYFSILNYLSLFLCLIIFKSLFYRKSDLFKFYFFLISLGAFVSSVAVYFYLIGNPDFLMIKNSINKGAATGFFINRTVFSCFLTLCFFCGIEYLRMIDSYKKNNPNIFFNKIYVRIFILLITIGIITSFSKLGNFLFISLITIYILRALFVNKKKSKFFLTTLILIVLFDVLILGFYFGSEKLLQRYSFLQEEINEYLPSSAVNSTSRGDLFKFSFIQFKNFIFFGYGSGGFEYLYKINFMNSSTLFASHVHSDLIEFIGEFGLVGTTLISLSIFCACLNNNFFSFKNFLLSYSIIFILLFDFSFHIPIIQFLFILLLSVNYTQSGSFGNKFNN